MTSQDPVRASNHIRMCYNVYASPSSVSPCMTHATVLFTPRFLDGRFSLMCTFSNKIESFESAQGLDNPVTWRLKFKRQPVTCDAIYDDVVFALT